MFRQVKINSCHTVFNMSHFVQKRNGKRWLTKFLAFRLFLMRGKGSVQVIRLTRRPGYTLITIFIRRSRSVYRVGVA